MGKEVYRMSYKEYLQEQLQALVSSTYEVKCYDEAEFNYEPKENEIAVIIKHLSGSIIGNVEFTPIQLEIYSTNNEVNYTREILYEFVKAYSNTNFNLGLDYYKQDYSTPIDAGNFNEIAEGFRTRFIVVGSLMITSSISDVDKVYIDGLEMNNTNVAFSYATNGNTRKESGNNLQKNCIENANLTITITMFKNADVFNNKLSDLKLGRRSPNEIHRLKFVYTDNDREEEYTCVIDSFTENHDRTNAPTRSVAFKLA